MAERSLLEEYPAFDTDSLRTGPCFLRISDLGSVKIILGLATPILRFRHLIDFWNVQSTVAHFWRGRLMKLAAALIATEVKIFVFHTCRKHVSLCGWRDKWPSTISFILKNVTRVWIAWTNLKEGHKRGTCIPLSLRKCTNLPIVSFVLELEIAPSDSEKSYHENRNILWNHLIIILS